jgi:hypothetical protein
MNFMRYSLSFLRLLVLCACGEAALAQTTVPHTFTSGTPARATEVNANFQALATAIDTLAARLDKLEGGPVTEADIVGGTYKASNLQIGIDHVAAGPAHIEAISYEGTITFAADHTFSFTFTGQQNDSGGPTLEDATVSGTWTLADNDLTFSVEGSVADTLHCAVGCRMIFGTLYGDAPNVGEDGHNNLMIMVRTN